MKEEELERRQSRLCQAIDIPECVAEMREHPRANDESGGGGRRHVERDGTHEDFERRVVACTPAAEVQRERVNIEQVRAGPRERVRERPNARGGRQDKLDRHATALALSVSLRAVTMMLRERIKRRSSVGVGERVQCPDDRVKHASRDTLDILDNDQQRPLARSVHLDVLALALSSVGTAGGGRTPELTLQGPLAT